MYDFETIQILKHKNLAIMSDSQNKNKVAVWKFEDNNWNIECEYDFSTVDLNNAILPITVLDKNIQIQSTWDYRQNRWVLITFEHKVINMNNNYIILYNLNAVN